MLLHAVKYPLYDFWVCSCATVMVGIIGGGYRTSCTALNYSCCTRVSLPPRMDILRAREPVNPKRSRPARHTQPTMSLSVFRTTAHGRILAQSSTSPLADFT
ncbi:hypothetical protein ARMSODRAFT_611513 [Armillaria solidipes]|uniref:Uncharacterized protein n=1 Tax=Armillaria solidipes TaxID=1076256 RepID=A0A2H3B7W0_9AGAR|nr:hypothetical protein ARMSODRAFT_611513 [Armillaria solidipes]